MAHLMGLPVGTRKCCSVVEMTVDGFHNLNQFGNQARYLGMSFFRWVTGYRRAETTKNTFSADGFCVPF
jgi:hypothetical protein